MKLQRSVRQAVGGVEEKKDWWRQRRGGKQEGVWEKTDTFISLPWNAAQQRESIIYNPSLTQRWDHPSSTSFSLKWHTKATKSALENEKTALFLNKGKSQSIGFLPAGEQISNVDIVALPSQCWHLPNLHVTRSIIVNLYLLRKARGIKEDRQHGVEQIAQSYPLNKTSKSIPGLPKHQRVLTWKPDRRMAAALGITGRALYGSARQKQNVEWSAAPDRCCDPAAFGPCMTTLKYAG